MDYSNPEFDVLNPADRAAVCVILDSSGSMRGAPIAALNEGYRAFLKSIREDDAAAMSVDLMTVELKDEPRLVHAFGPVESYPETPEPLVASGCTGTDKALRLGLSAIDERVAFYRHNAVGVLKPWIVILQDGKPDSMSRTRVVVDEICRRRDAEQLNYLCVGVGDKVNWDQLDKLSGNDAWALEGLDFSGFFKWLSRSLRQVSVAGVDGERFVRFGSTADWARARA